MQQKNPAYFKGLERLASKEYTVSELRAFLRRKEYADDEINSALFLLQEQGYLNDERALEALVRAYAHKRKGPRYILEKLREKGLRPDLEQVRQLYCEQADISERDQIENFLKKRIQNKKWDTRLQKHKDLQRLQNTLLRRGFSLTEIQRQLKNYS